jgi:hypothetical protein
VSYVLKILLYLDQLGEALLWRDSGLTISARCGLALRHPNEHNGFWRWLGGVLNRMERGHCEGAITNDAARAREALRILESDS